ncbi:hypothetical protein SASPL_104376 [Salvia splendens]|uniref:DNA repair protein RAD5 n=1 Tax=Salvia splendens TaxID=180675 RepID=A0A8X8YJT4_SALSN|nr:hypothetical protein SASPL_104376 [Salvia splendens]
MVINTLPFNSWWNKLVQKPFEAGDGRGLTLVQSILKSIMLRRTKSSTDREGRQILVLPPADIQVVYCNLTEAEKDFKKNQSRGDTQEYSDLNKLAKRFLKDGQDNVNGQTKDIPSRAYIQEVVEELRKGEEGECPICLEAFEDAVLTPCAHRLCRECVLSSWRGSMSGLCPLCRKAVSKQELITAPTDSRFQVDVEKNWVESSKVSALMGELGNLESAGTKSIVFSQWTAFFDLLQIPLSRYCFNPLTHIVTFHFLFPNNNSSAIGVGGVSTATSYAAKSVVLFIYWEMGLLFPRGRAKGSPISHSVLKRGGVLVLLMSLKAGGVGINLTAASNAFVMDPWWNPAVEEQAVMRIHRIGQTNKVDTVEERMEAVQARKQRMISGALTDQEVRTARIEELKIVFT